ncbi:MAG: acetyl-CoA decarbonylase/synthase complex subunit gamma [Planctomycetes bacterium]|nr:acetyl-CoA decarbonylase/synthase complex subunit gamma [Planctomycetota bacterium]
MALTGLDIYKKLPKTNCKECGLPTCLAFAMKVAAGQLMLDQCPKLSDSARGELSEASAPPQRLVKLGADGVAVEVGQETVLFRHEERFHHPAAVALTLSDSASVEVLRSACADFRKLQFPRVGTTIHPDMIALIHESGSPDKFVSAAELVCREAGVPMVLVSGDRAALLAAACGPLAGRRPLLYCRGDVSSDQLADLAEQSKSPICVAGDIASVAAAAEALIARGVKDILISPGPADTAAAMSFLTQARRAALKKKYRPLGFPVLAIAAGGDKFAAAMDACAYICKYAAVLITDAWEPHLLVPILTSRQNIYTDPQKPVQVEAKLYDVGEAVPASPLLVTTNFSLSYYSVEGEVEAARVPCRILAVNTEGTSVLTAWAADKFNPSTISAALKAAGAESKVSHHKIIIPGHVAVISAQLAEESGWQVLVGPREASGIGPYLKNEWRA